MTSTDSCPSCGQPRTTRHCGTCGERRLDPDELSFRRFLHSLAEELLPGFEPDEPGAVRRMGGRVYRTVYTLFRYPGRLTADYIAGRRRPYLKPVQVFLAVALVFFLFGHHYFQFRLSGYYRAPFLGEVAPAAQLEQQRLKLSQAEYEERFDGRLAEHKKAVMALTVPLFAVAFMPLFRRRGYGEHLVFSVHFFALQLLFMITVMFAFSWLAYVFAEAIARSAPRLAGGIQAALNSDLGNVLLVYTPLYVYLVLALQRVYGGRRLVNAIKGFALVIWHIVMLVVVFRHTLFFTTFYSLKWFD